MSRRRWSTAPSAHSSTGSPPCWPAPPRPHRSSCGTSSPRSARSRWPPSSARRSAPAGRTPPWRTDTLRTHWISTTSSTHRRRRCTSVLACGRRLWRSPRCVRVTGAKALASYVAGFEVGARVARAAGITHFESAWQVTGTAGHLASAAAAARALGLGGAAAAHALGMAAAQASGIREIYGSDAKALQPGRAAMDGVLTALMAERGMTARDTALEGERGLLSVISRDPQPDILVRLAGRGMVCLVERTQALSECLAAASDDRRGDRADQGSELRRATTWHPSRCRMLPFAASVTGVTHPGAGLGGALQRRALRRVRAADRLSRTRQLQRRRRQRPRRWRGCAMW